MKNLIFKALYAVFAVMILLSCAKTPHTLPPTEKSTILKFNLRIPTASPDTYSAPSATETELDNIYVFFVKTTTSGVKSASDLVHSVARIGKADIGDNSSNALEKTFDVELKATGSDINAQFYCYLVTNIDGIVIDKTDSSEGTTLGAAADLATLFNNLTYAQLSTKLQTAYNPATLGTKNITMWGESTQYFTPVATTLSEKIPLIRSVARIDVGVGHYSEGSATVQGTWSGKEADGSTVIPFDITSIQVFRPYDTYAFMPLWAAKTSMTTNIVNSHSAVGAMKAATTTNANEPLYQPTAEENFVRYIYLPEANVIGTDGEINDANHTERCAVVIGGIYTGAPYGENTEITYYRIDFNQAGALINVLRNHLYRFSISEVKGIGHATPKSAYDSKSMNMTAEIVDWTVQSGIIIIDGQNYIELGGKRVTLSGVTGKKEFVYVKTNIDPADWTMTFGTNQTIPTGGPTTAVKVESDNFSFERKIPKITPTPAGAEVTYEGVFEIITKQDLAKGTASVTHTVTIKTGTMAFDIIITQKPSGAEDWDDGGDQGVTL